MTCQAATLKWPELNRDELVSFYNQIKLNKLLDISWRNPGRVDPSAYQAFHEKKLQKNTETEASNELIKEQIPSNESLTPTDDKFDLFNEFNEEEAEKEDEIFNLRLTHRKRSTEAKVACMDKILGDMKRNFVTEKNMVNEEDELKEEALNNTSQVMDQDTPNGSEVNKELLKEINFELEETQDPSKLENDKSMPSIDPIQVDKTKNESVAIPESTELGDASSIVKLDSRDAEMDTGCIDKEAEMYFFEILNSYYPN